jgi:hypothetical protein
MQALGLVWRGVDAAVACVQEKRTPIAAPVHFGARLLFENWRKLRAQDGFVVHRDVPSRALASVLRNLVIFEPLDGMADFRVRLAGSAMIRRFDCDITGLKLSELFDPVAFAGHRDAMIEIARQGTASIHDVKFTARNRTDLHFEAIGLPVQSPDRSAVWILGGIFYHDWTK